MRTSFRQATLIAGVAAASVIAAVDTAGAQLGPGISKGSLTVPDANRLYDWTKAGVTGASGGVPNTSNARQWPVIDTDRDTVGSCTPFTAGEKSDEIDDTTKIRCYLAYAATQAGIGGRLGTVVKLGAGTFTHIKVNASLGIDVPSNVVLRGAGMGTTTIYAPQDYSPYCKASQSRAIVCIAAEVNPLVYSNLGVALSADINPGDTTISFASDPGYAAGAFILVREKIRDPGRLPANQAWEAIEQVYMVTGGSGTTRTIDRGSYQWLKVTYEATAYRWASNIHNAGVENLTVSGNPALTNPMPGGIAIAGAYDVWVTGVEVKHGGTFNIYAERSRNFTIANTYTHNVQWFDEGHYTQAYNMIVQNGSNDFLIVNNRISDVVIGINPHISPIRGVIAYNYFWNLTVHARAILLHGSYPSQILIEGNAGDGCNLSSDNYWSYQQSITYFRNRFLGEGNNPSGIGGFVHSNDNATKINAKFETQLLNVYQDLAKIPFCSQPWPHDCWDIDKLTTDSWYEKNRFTSLLIRKYDNGSDEPTATYVSEPGVYATGGGFVGPAIKDRAHTSSPWFVTGYDGVSPPSAWRGLTFPASFFLTGKPWWWCNETPWPGIGADVDITTNLSKTPAQRMKEGLPCSVPAALGVPGRPALIP